MKNKTNSVLIIAFCFIFSVFAGWLFLLADKDCVNRISFSVPEYNTSVYLYNSGKGVHYAFLPSCADLEDVIFYIPNNYSMFVDGENNNDKIKLQLNKDYNLKIKNIFGMTISATTLVIMKSENVPSLSISIDNGTLENIHSDKNIKKTGNIVSVGSDSKILYSGQFKGIHGRGNSSWEKAKKPYNIEFEDEVDLVGLGGAKEYALIASATENSFLRNKIAYDVAGDLGLKYSPESAFVDLYINGEYLGLYLLVEKFEINTNRINLNPLQEQVEKINQFKLESYSGFSIAQDGLLKTGYNIPNNPSDITGAYIVEIDPRYILSDNVFCTSSQLYFSVYYPSACSEAQMDYISDLFIDIENGFSDGTYLQYIDLESWAKYYLVQEFFANIDIASFFFYKDRFYIREISIFSPNTIII